MENKKKHVIFNFKKVTTKVIIISVQLLKNIVIRLEKYT